MQRESFVIHAEYIEDLPEDYKQKFLWCIYEYAVKGIEPEFTGLEQTICLKIQRRIDSELSQWEETKQRRSEAGRRGGLKNGEKHRNEAMLQSALTEAKQNEANEAMLQSASTEAKQTEANEAVYVSDSVSVSVNESVSESECVSVGADAPEKEHSLPPSDYSTLQKTLFSMLQTHNKESPVESRIPVSNNFISFIQKECRDLITVMRGSPPSVILQTVQNLLKSAKQKRKKHYSWHFFLTDINEYMPDYFADKTTTEEKPSGTDDFYRRMKNDGRFNAGLFLVHQKDWTGAGCPEGESYFELQKQWEVKNAS